MSRVINLTGILDDGTGQVLLAPRPAIQAAYGESFTIHLVIKTPSGKQVFAVANKVVAYGARRTPLPEGQLLFQHLGAISPAGDGGWDLPVVASDYQLIAEGAGRFFFDIWLTDNSVSPSVSNPILTAAAFIVTQAAISPSAPATSVTPTPIIAYGLPNPQPSGAFLQAAGFSGGIGQVGWATVESQLFGALSVGPQPITRNELYVRNSGSDVTGTGTLANPYRSVKHAVDMAVPQIRRGQRYVIDITGLNDTIDTLVIPPHLSDQEIIFFFGNTEIPQAFREGYLNIQAVPKVLATLSSSTTSSQDAITGLYTYTDPLANWTPGAFVGKFITGAGSGQCGVIYSNTATQLVMSLPSSFASLTGPVNIVDCGASLTCNSGLAVILAYGTLLSLTGIELTPNGMNAIIAERITAQMCRFHQLLAIEGGHSSLGGAIFQACDFVGSNGPHTDFSFGSYATVYDSRLFQSTPAFVTNGLLQNSILDSTSILNGDDFATQSVNIENCYLNRCSVVVWPGQMNNINNCRIDNSPGSGITIVGSGQVIFNDDGQNIAGTGNARYGIELQNGARCYVNPSPLPTITGGLGDLKVGTLPVRSWLDFSTNQPLGIQRDVTGDGSLFMYVGATATTSTVVTFKGNAAWSTIYPQIAAARATYGSCIVLLDGDPENDSWTIDNTFPTINLDDVRWYGIPLDVVISVNAGVSWVGRGNLYSRSVGWLFNGTFITTANQTIWIVEDGGIINLGSTAVIVSTDTTGNEEAEIISVRSFLNPISGPIMQLAGGGVGAYSAFADTTIGTNGPIFKVPNSGANASVIVSFDSSCAGNPTKAGLVTGTQVSFSVVAKSKSTLVAYAPALGTNWNPVPTMAAGALDQLASRSLASRTSDAVIPQYALVMPSATNAGRVLPLAPTGPVLFTGVAQATAAAAGTAIPVLEGKGNASPMISDGKTAINLQSVIQPSTIAAGLVMAGTANPIGVAITTAASGASGALISVI